jgi:hypothetical protein
MRPALEAVKLRIANVAGSRHLIRLPKGAILAIKNTANCDIFARGAARSRTPGNALIAASGQIDENGSLPYKPRQLSAMARFDRGGSFWAGNGPLWARQHPRTYLIYQA